jgi:hypothetical protein
MVKKMVISTCKFKFPSYASNRIMKKSDILKDILTLGEKLEIVTGTIPQFPGKD